MTKPKGLTIGTDMDRFEVIKEDEALPSPKVQVEPNPDPGMEKEPPVREPGEHNWIPRFGIQPPARLKEPKSEEVNWIPWIDALVDSSDRLVDMIMGSNRSDTVDKFLKALQTNESFKKVVNAISPDNRLAQVVGAITGEDEETVKDFLYWMGPTGVVSNRQLAKWMIKSTPAAHRKAMLPIAKKAAKLIPESVKKSTKSLSYGPERLLRQYGYDVKDAHAFGLQVAEKAKGRPMIPNIDYPNVNAQSQIALDKARMLLQHPEKAVSTALHELGHVGTTQNIGKIEALHPRTKRMLFKAIEAAPEFAGSNIDELMAYSYEARQAAKLGIPARYPQLADTKLAKVSEILFNMKPEDIIDKNTFRALKDIDYIRERLARGDYMYSLVDTAPLRPEYLKK